MKLVAFLAILSLALAALVALLWKRQPWPEDDFDAMASVQPADPVIGTVAWWLGAPESSVTARVSPVRLDLTRVGDDEWVSIFRHAGRVARWWR